MKVRLTCSYEEYIRYLNKTLSQIESNTVLLNHNLYIKDVHGDNVKRTIQMMFNTVNHRIVEYSDFSESSTVKTFINGPIPVSEYENLPKDTYIIECPLPPYSHLEYIKDYEYDITQFKSDYHIR